MTQEDIPYGYCRCGCGNRTTLIASSHAPRGYIKGEPYPYCRGHNGRDKDRRGLLGDSYFTIADCGHETACWVWLRCRNDKGYGVSYSAERKCQMLAHRVVYEQRVGPIPTGMQLDHLCFNTSCVNPDHLEAVTALVNSRRRRDAKLTDDQRREIAEMYATGDHSKRSLARRFGVTDRVIFRVILQPPEARA